MKGEELLNYKSVHNWIESLDRVARQRGKYGLTKIAKEMRLGRMWEYTEEGKLNPEDFLKEAKENIDNAGKRLDKYFNEKIKSGASWNTAVTNVSFLRGFYTHNDLMFPKRWGIPKRKVSNVSSRDEKTALYDYDDEKREVIFKNGTLQHFVQNLSFRDQTISLCLMPTGADATDLLKLNVEFVKDGKGKLQDVKRFYWHSNREKDGVEFKVFFSEEATEFLKRFVEQERKDASDDEPLFAKEDSERLDAHALAMNFRVSANKMGYVKKAKASPFRPKRFRHWFRTACGIAHIEEGYIKAFMGHASDVSASYLERNKGLFEMQYVKVEPLVTVFGINKSAVNEMSQKVEGLKDDIKDLAVESHQNKVKAELLEKKNVELEEAVNNLSDELAKSNAAVQSWIQLFQQNYLPLLRFVDTLSELPEFEELKKKAREAKLETLEAEGRENEARQAETNKNS